LSPFAKGDFVSAVRGNPSQSPFSKGRGSGSPLAHCHSVSLRTIHTPLRVRAGALLALSFWTSQDVGVSAIMLVWRWPVEFALLRRAFKDMVDALIIAAGGMAVVFAGLGAVWLVMSTLGWIRMPGRAATPPPIASAVEETPLASVAGDEDVAAIAAALLQPESGKATVPAARRAVSTWRAVVR